MRPTFMGFEAAKSSVFTNQKSIDIVGNNLANLNTAGYTRQRVDRTSVSPSSYSNRVAANRVGLTGQGVDTLGVSQMRDSFLDKRFRDEYSKAAYHGQAGAILDDIQAALGDGHNITDESGLYDAMRKIFTSINDYAKEPTMDTQANLVMSAFKNMSQVLQQLDGNLTSVANQQIVDMKVTVDRTNEILSQLANLNKMIGEDATVRTDPDNEYFRPNELLDERNLLLDELSSYADITITEHSNGMVDVQMAGENVVKGTVANGLAMAVNNSGQRDQTVALQWRSSGSSANLGGGALKSYVEYINGRGNNVRSSAETPNQGILYYRDRLDTFANALSKMVNQAIPEYDETTKLPKEDADGNIIYKKLVEAKNGNGGTSDSIPITAANFTVSDAWKQGGAGYFIYNKQEGEPKYAQQIAINLTEGSFTFESYGEKFTGSFVDYEVDMLGRVGTDVAFHNGRQEATGMVADDYQERRDAISGVSKDEETADMLKFQKSYEAAARLMTTLDDLLDIVINRMGRVGL